MTHVSLGEWQFRGIVEYCLVPFFSGNCGPTEKLSKGSLKSSLIRVYEDCDYNGGGCEDYLEVLGVFPDAHCPDSDPTFNPEPSF